MTDNELKALVASLAITQKETSREIKDLFISQKETTRQFRETKQQIAELGKQIGGLGRKFGSFTEGLALPSMQAILQDQFYMEVISPSVRVKKGNKEIEIDVLAYANNGVNAVYLVEVKSHLREEGITQLQKMIQKFRHFFPEHQDKKLYGILAAVDMSLELKQRILSLGFYTANIKEDIFSLNVPSDFQAKAY
jgi:hypothetical protein